MKWIRKVVRKVRRMDRAYRRAKYDTYRVSRLKRRIRKMSSFFCIGIMTLLWNMQYVLAIGQDVNNVSNNVLSEAQLAVAGIVVIGIAVVGILFATGQKKLAQQIAVSIVIGAGIIMLLPSVANFIIGLFR